LFVALEPNRVEHCRESPLYPRFNLPPCQSLDHRAVISSNIDNIAATSVLFCVAVSLSLPSIYTGNVFSVVFVLKKRETERDGASRSVGILFHGIVYNAPRSEWTEKNCARDDEGEGDGARERAKNLANEFSGRTVEEKVAALFVYPSTTDHVSIDGEKKAFNLHLTTTLSSRD
jgi:hypothetical protein